MEKVSWNLRKMAYHQQISYNGTLLNLTVLDPPRRVHATSVLDMTLNNHVEAPVMLECLFIAIAPRSALAQSDSTW